MKLFLFYLTVLLIPAGLKAQTAQDSVKAVVNKLFEAMKKSDSALLKATFTNQAILQTVTNDKTGKTVIENDTVDEFAKIVQSLPQGDADERIVFDMIKIDGPLAIVWAPYNFYYKGKFSHCGVDSFQLVLIDGEWKIQYLVDTRRKTGCN
ncbi:MAG: nuclear transport factor 2 family protein [Bacteroidetes bacterium]|nr:nuclear transport factor 2 family protein [Bacteroidota bacterium]